MVFDLQRFFLLFSSWVCGPEPLPGADGNLLGKFSLPFLSFYIWSLTELKHAPYTHTSAGEKTFCACWKTWLIQGCCSTSNIITPLPLVSMETSFPSRLISDRCESARTAGGAAAGGWGGGSLFVQTWPWESVQSLYYSARITHICEWMRSILSECSPLGVHHSPHMYGCKHHNK